MQTENTKTAQTWGQRVIPQYQGETDPSKMTAHQICEKVCKEDATNIADAIYGTYEIYEKDNPVRSHLLMNVIKDLGRVMQSLDEALAFNEA